jgi:hypothetical protein
MTGLHLPGPHLCPACNVVHDMRDESKLFSNAVRAKKDHIGTFLPIASNGQTAPTRCYGLFGSGGTQTLLLSENSIPNFGIASSNYPYVFSIGSSGWYSIAITWQVYQHQNNTTTCSIVTTRGTRTSNPVNTNGSGDCGTGTYWESLLFAGDTITFQGTQAPYTWTGDNSFSIDFVPTPQYRK